MLNSQALNTLLKQGRIVQQEVASLIKAPKASSSLVTAHIDDLINLIKPHMLTPSPTEKNEVGLVVTSLGRIIKNLSSIKHAIKPH